MPGLADKFAVNLKSERLRRKLSQEALAAKAGLSVSYISMLERGQRTPPLDTLESLAKALAVSPPAHSHLPQTPRPARAAAAPCGFSTGSMPGESPCSPRRDRQK